MYLIFGEPDPRTDKYIFQDSVWYPIGTVAIYLAAIYKILPAYMENRKPYKLRKTLIVYNTIQIMLNIFVLSRGIESFKIYPNWFCLITDFSSSYHGLRELSSCYFYYIVKIIDLFDTIFFVLKKNNRQITVLHVSHHVGLVLLSWSIFKFQGGGQLMWMGFLNCCVHIVMYSYYLLSAYDQTYTSNVSIKQYVTLTQMAQFVVGIYIFSYPLIHSECETPKFTSALITAVNTYLLVMFSNFYRRTYLCRSEKS